MTFTEQLTATLRQRRAELQQAESTLAELQRDHAQAEQHFQALCDAPRNPNIVTIELDDARIAAQTLGDKLRHQQDAVRELQREVHALAGRADAPAALKAAVAELASARRATADAVAERDRHAERIGRLESQHAAELQAGEAARLWQESVILARVEGTAPPSGQKPEHAPQEHQQVAAVLARMIESGRAAVAQQDAQIAELRAAEREAERATLEAQVAVRELEYAAALADFAPVWSRFSAAHFAAHSRLPEAPDLGELGAIDDAELLAEARSVLQPQPEGALRKLARKVAEALP